MKTLLAAFVLLAFVNGYSLEIQDSTKNQDREQEQIKEQNQEQLREQNRHQENIGVKKEEGKKRMKDVFVDKDGDGIADTRAGGMSLNKLRKRTRAGSKGSGGNGPGEGGKR